MDEFGKDIAKGAEPSGEDESGTELGGRYTLLRKLATGGSATVYEAADKRFDRRLAVKISGPKLSEAQTRRFVQEAQIGAAIDHPNLAYVVDHGGIGGAYFITMQLVAGTDFATHLAEHGPVSWQDSLDLVQGLLQALAGLHAHGVVHRDVSSSNCLIESTGDRRVRLVDLGNAKIVDETRVKRQANLTSDTHRIYGTLGYIAPERFFVDDDYSVDVYAAGVVWYELLTGHAMPLPACISKHYGTDAQSRPVGPPLRALKLPRALRDVLATAVATEREHRYPDAASMLAALQAARATVHSPGRRTRSPVKPWMVASLAVAGLVAAVASPLAFRTPATACEPVAPASVARVAAHDRAVSESVAAASVAAHDRAVAEPAAPVPEIPASIPSDPTPAPVRESPPPTPRSKPRTFAAVMHSQTPKIRACFGEDAMPGSLVVQVIFDSAGHVQSVRIPSLPRSSAAADCITQVVVTAAPPAQGKPMVEHTFSRK